MNGWIRLSTLFTGHNINNIKAGSLAWWFHTIHAAYQYQPPLSPTPFTDDRNSFLFFGTRAWAVFTIPSVLSIMVLPLTQRSTVRRIRRNRKYYLCIGSKKKLTVNSAPSASRLHLVHTRVKCNLSSDYNYSMLWSIYQSFEYFSITYIISFYWVLSRFFLTHAESKTFQRSCCNKSRFTSEVDNKSNRDLWTSSKTSAFMTPCWFVSLIRINPGRYRAWIC